MRTHLNRYVGVSRVIEHGVKPFAKDVYIKVTVWSLTTSGSTGKVAWLTCQLASLVVQRIGVANLRGLSPW